MTRELFDMAEEPFLFIGSLLEALMFFACFVSGRLSLVEAWLGGEVN
jgi:hypothetical protein